MYIRCVNCECDCDLLELVADTEQTLDERNREIERSIFFPIPFNRMYELCANPNIIDFGWWTFFQWIDYNNNNKTQNSFEFDPGSTVYLFILFFLV